MQEKGALKKILDKYQAPPQVCPDSSGLPLGFDSCFTAFLGLIGGMAIGLICFLIECGSKVCGVPSWILELRPW